MIFLGGEYDGQPVPIGVRLSNASVVRMHGKTKAADDYSFTKPPADTVLPIHIYRRVTFSLAGASDTHYLHDGLSEAQAEVLYISHMNRNNIK